MELAPVCDILKELEETSGRIVMTEMISGFLAEVPDNELSNVLLIIRGTPFPPWSDKELGISDKLMERVISQVSGASEASIGDMIRELGDLGQAAEKALVNKPQTTLFSQTLSVEKVMENLEKLATLTGKGSQDKKLAYVSELLSNATSLESRYLVRLILGQLRVGVGDGVMRDAIAMSYGLEPTQVERAFNLRPDWGEVAASAKNKGEQGLAEYGLTVGSPMKVMLAQKATGLSQALEDLGEVELEIKYDGARIQIHKGLDDIQLFTRRLEDVTKQFPEIVEMARTGIKAKTAIVEGEAVAFDPETKRPLPFQFLSRRIKRKHDIAKLAEKVPAEMNLFDIIYLDGEPLVGLPFSARRERLSQVIEQSPIFRLAESLVTSDIEPAEAFYAKALEAGHEGVMVKVLSAPYQPGSRVGHMYKVKPVMESLDLVVTGATWGEGRRASWLGSYLLSVYDPESGQYLTIGRMATGLTDEKLAELTELFRPLIAKTDGRECEIRPHHIFEVAYEEIQKSPTYGSGYALRFPRLVRVRDDKGVEDADTLGRVESLIDGVG